MHLIQSFKQYIDSSLKLQVIHYKMSRWNYSYGLNILRVFDFWRNICFTTTKKSLIISANHDIFELSQEMPRDVRLRILDLSLPPKIKFFSIVAKNPWKIETELFSQCAISLEKWNFSHIFCPWLWIENASLKCYLGYKYKRECFQLFLDWAHALVLEGRFLPAQSDVLVKLRTKKICRIELNLSRPKNIHFLINEALV